MKTKQNFFMKSALMATAAVALSGCIKEKIAPEDTNELKFVLNVTMPDDTDTRALKPGWVSGDKIMVFFDTNATQYAFFNYDGTDWVVYNGMANTDAINTVEGNPLQAIHAGSSDFDFNGTTLSGISGDILYDQTGGTYTVDAGTNTAYVNLVMERGFTTVIKLQGSADQATNENWRLAGSNLWVMGSTTSLAATDIVQNPEFYLQSLFVLSNASTGVVAVPDTVFTDDTQAVFHVWDKSNASDGTSIDVYSTDDTTDIYERDYTADLTTGSTTVVMAPDSSESGSWINTGLTPVATAVALDGVTAPAAGSTPAAAVTSTSSEFTAAIAWDPADAAFAAGTAYTATVTLTSAAGKTFTGSSFTTDDPASVAGFTAGGMAPTGVTNNGDTLVLTYAFAATPATLVTAAALTGVVVPETGATPDTTITTASTQFTAALVWDPADSPFAAGTVYTATITLTAGADYTFTGDFGDTTSIAGFTVNGTAPTAWTSNDGTTLVFTYAFPATSANVIDYDADDDDVTLN